MIRLRLPDAEMKRRAFGLLAGRFDFERRASGELIVPELALALFALGGVASLAEGPAPYGRIGPPSRGTPTPPIG